MIGLWLIWQVAWADPIVLRAPSPGIGASVGLHSVSAGGWWNATNGVGVSWSWPSGAVTLDAAHRFELAESPRGGFATAWLGGGLVLPTATPAVGLEVIPAIGGGYLGRHFIGSGVLTAPVAVVVGPHREVDLRVPVLVELNIGGRAGPMWITTWLRMGASWSPDVGTSVIVDPGISLVWAPVFDG